MAASDPFNDDQPFSERIKAMPVEDLLDVWEETQQLGLVLRRELHVELEIVPEYEKMILFELQRRSNGKKAASPR